MSKIWKTPINIPDNVTVDISWNRIVISWPKGEQSLDFVSCVNIEKNENIIQLSVSSDKYYNYRWLTRSLVANIVEWVSKWFEKKLMILWVWFTSEVKWDELELNVWYSHKVQFPIPKWITITVEKDPKWHPIVTVQWIDKQLVGQTSAKIRDIRKPEPYKWKWIRYLHESVKMKAWKSGKK